MQWSSRHIAFVSPKAQYTQYRNTITCAYMSDWSINTFVTLVWSTLPGAAGIFPEKRWGETHLVFLCFSCFLCSQEAKPWKPNWKGNRQTESSFQTPWHIIRVGCGFEAVVNKVSVKRICDVEVRLSKQGWFPVKRGDALILEYMRVPDSRGIMSCWESGTGERNTLWCFDDSFLPKSAWPSVMLDPQSEW